MCAMVKLLLAHGADPNSGVDSSGNAMTSTNSSEIRALLGARGGTIDPYDTSWVDNDAELKRVAGDPREAVRVAAGFTMVVSDGRRDRLERMLAAGLRVPPVLTGCQTYLLTHADMLRTLLGHGMSPDLMNWQRQTLLHHICSQPEMKRWISSGASDAIEKATILLDAGANISAYDEEYHSTPLAWASRSGAVEMVKFLLSRGAPTSASRRRAVGDAAGVGRTTPTRGDRVSPPTTWNWSIAESAARPRLRPALPRVGAYGAATFSGRRAARSDTGCSASESRRVRGRPRSRRAGRSAPSATHGVAD